MVRPFSLLEVCKDKVVKYQQFNFLARYLDYRKSINGLSEKSKERL